MQVNHSSDIVSFVKLWLLVWGIYISFFEYNILVTCYILNLPHGAWICFSASVGPRKAFREHVYLHQGCALP